MDLPDAAAILEAKTACCARPRKRMIEPVLYLGMDALTWHSAGLYNASSEIDYPQHHSQSMVRENPGVIQRGEVEGAAGRSLFASLGLLEKLDSGQLH